jgi:hypothetical protein
MSKFRYSVLALVFFGHASVAQQADEPKILNEEAFSSYVTGKTLTYSKHGEFFGTEEYLPNNRVRWSLSEGECQEGRWFAQAEKICFLYQGQNQPQCWSFLAGDTGLIAQFGNTPTSGDIVESFKTTVPLYCHGPDVGV